MLKKNECEIIKNWNGKDVAVSVFCTVYNHEKYLERCLDGILSQKTTFPYELIIHDDCSTDNSVEILRLYESRFPSILSVIYEKDNQYSKGVFIRSEIMFPRSKGKYVALCEGDDYWIDENKLQKQFDFMEKHQRCSMSVHNTVKHDLITDQDDLFNKWNEEKKLTEEDVFIGWNVHTSSYFMKRELAFTPLEFKYWFGDYVMLTMAFNIGDIWFLPDIMSVYNYNNKAGMTCSSYSDLRAFKQETLRVDFLNKYNDFTEYRFNSTIEKRLMFSNIALANFQANQEHSFQNYKKLKHAIKNNYQGFVYYSSSEKLKLKFKTLNYLFFLIYQNIRTKRV